MSKTDTDLHDVKCEKPRRAFRKPSWTYDENGDRTVNAFDYETAKAMPFMLAYDYDGDESGAFYRSFNGGFTFHFQRQNDRRHR